MKSLSREASPFRTRSLKALFALLLLPGLGACGGAGDAAEGPETGEGPNASGVETPQAAASPRPPAASRSEGATGAAATEATMPAGTVLVFRVQDDVSTATHRPGDRILLRLVEDVRGEGGAVLASGTEARAVVTESARSTGAETSAVLALQVASIRVNGGYQDLEGRVLSTELEAGARDSGQRSVAKVATGAAAGAAIGQILGRDTRAAVAGAAAGAAAGLGIALTTRDGHAVLPEGSLVTVRLEAPLSLSR